MLVTAEWALSTRKLFHLVSVNFYYLWPLSQKIIIFDFIMFASVWSLKFPAGQERNRRETTTDLVPVYCVWNWEQSVKLRKLLFVQLVTKWPKIEDCFFLRKPLYSFNTSRNIPLPTQSSPLFNFKLRINF